MTPRQPRASCGLPSAAIRETAGSTTIWRGAWRSWRGEEKRYVTTPTARSIRPEFAHKLAHVLEDNGESDEAIEVFGELREQQRGRADHRICLGRVLQARGRSQEANTILDGAIGSLRAALLRKPDDYKTRANLGLALRSRGRTDAAIAECREAIRLKPDLANAHNTLGLALAERGKLDDAIAEYGEAIRLKPDIGHFNLANALRAREAG